MQRFQVGAPSLTTGYKDDLSGFKLLAPQVLPGGIGRNPNSGNSSLGQFRKALVDVPGAKCLKGAQRLKSFTRVGAWS